MRPEAICQPVPGSPPRRRRPGLVRTELQDKLCLAGAEVSVNNLPAGTGVPFVPSHKQNEEIYVILAGKGKALIDGQAVEPAEGDWLRLSPRAKRQFSAAADAAICFACIQVKENSLEGYTMDDAVAEGEQKRSEATPWAIPGGRKSGGRPFPFRRPLP